MRILIRAVILVAVLSVELYAVYAVLHPHVSPEYRAYYIDHTTNDWNPPHYAATPEQGIDFAHAGWPDFVRNGYGFSYREAEGRWTDGGVLQTPRIELNRQFSGPLCIELRLRPAYAELNHQLGIAMGRAGRRPAVTLRRPGAGGSQSAAAKRRPAAPGSRTLLIANHVLCLSASGAMISPRTSGQHGCAVLIP